MIQDLSRQFSELGALLRQHQQYWCPVAFHSVRLPWMDQHPELVQRLLELPHQQIEQLATDADALTAFLLPTLPFAEQLQQLAALQMLPARQLPSVPARFYAGIPGRKWQQVEAFSGCIPASSLPLLEWCAGKSHLGFLLQHHHDQVVTALEWDARLVAQANRRAQQDNLPLKSVAVNVLTADVDGLVQKNQQVIALHACGELHERLLQLSVAHQVSQLHLAPCCYHKREQPVYVPLSALGRELNLSLDKNELHTAVMETVTAGATLQRQRVRLQMMRLGFDCLQRTVRGADEFLPLPSLAARWARAEFADFCRHCADLKGLTLPHSVDWQQYWQRGEERFWHVSALDLVRFLFRRPLEVWLALDRALLLQEQGYQVQIGTFCPHQVTPRNILVQASRY